MVVGRPVAPSGDSGLVGARLENQLAEFADVQSADGGCGHEDWLALADAFADARGPVGVVDAAYVGHTSPLMDTVADSRLNTAQLYNDGLPVGVVRVGPRDLRVAEEIARNLGAEGEPLLVATFASRLISAGVSVTPVELAPYVGGVTDDPAEARQLVEKAERTDEHQLRLVASARPGDGFYSTFVVRKIARRVTAAALQLGLRPDVITMLSLLVGLGAAASFAVGQQWAIVAGAVLLQASLVLDCVDGEVARYTLRFSPFGAWLDAVADRVKEFAVYAGLAVGAAAVGADVWLLACAALALLVVRHHVDFGFAVRQSARASDVAPDRDGAMPRLANAGRAAARLSDLTNRRSAQMWAKRVVIMPIGERWLIISVVGAIWGARAVFVTLLVTGTGAALYTTVGRVLRSAAEAVPLAPDSLRDLAVLTDAPGVVGPAPWLAKRYTWLLPAASRLVEFGAVLAIAAALGEGSLVAAYVVLAVVALRLYDLVYRLRHLRTPPAGWTAPAALGAPGRAAVLVIAALAGEVAFVATALATALLVLAVSAADARGAWRRDDVETVLVQPLRKVT